MKKSLFILGTLLFFGVAQAQTDTTRTSKKQRTTTEKRHQDGKSETKTTKRTDAQTDRTRSGQNGSDNPATDGTNRTGTRRDTTSTGTTPNNGNVPRP